MIGEQGKDLKMDLSALIVRQVTKADLPGLEWEGEYTHFRRLYTEAYHRAELSEAVLWVAELRGRLIGQLFVHLERRQYERSNGEMRAYIYGFRVRPAYRSQGIGSHMLEMVEADLLRRGYRKVSLNVGQDNQAARRLYERKGYSVVGSDPGRWSYLDHEGNLREVVEPAWRMEKMLGEGSSKW
jgi:ribosomal protein S18 acetylase RimI-like enzyme